ncbi:MAG: entericidin A/B family lipoprotein [Candidatus Levyibacteriota bacterium]
MIRKLVAWLALAGLLAGLAGCNTIEGAGKDIKAAGQAVERAAKDSK